jgi:adenosylmethionine-8-amino-7-oxononanoate aminotransferase
MAAGSHSGRRDGYEPLLLDFPKVPWDDAEAAVEIIEREDPTTIAAFLFEPITGAAGACLTASDEYWQTIADVCRRHDILLVADEVMTGFGRTGARWGHEHLPFEPDVLFGGKGLGGGYVPMGMVAATDAVVEPLRGSRFMYYTFSASDGACAGAAAVLDVLEAEHLVERSASMGDVLGKLLSDALGDHPAVVDLRGRGLFRGIELTPSGGRLTVAVVNECLARDMWIYPAGSGPVEDAVMIGCPLTISNTELELLVDTLRAAIDAATA